MYRSHSDFYCIYVYWSGINVTCWFVSLLSDTRRGFEPSSWTFFPTSFPRRSTKILSAIVNYQLSTIWEFEETFAVARKTTRGIVVQRMTACKLGPTNDAVVSHLETGEAIEKKDVHDDISR